MSDQGIIDLTNYKDRVGSRVVPGRYTVVVEDAEWSESSNGNPMITLWYRVLNGEFEGRTIIDRLTQTEGALFRTVGFMQALGFPTPEKRLQVNLRQWVGKVLDIDVEDGDPYNGRVKSEVRGYNRASKSEGQSSAADLDDILQETDSLPETADEAPETVDLDSIDLG